DLPEARGQVPHGARRPAGHGSGVRLTAPLARDPADVDHPPRPRASSRARRTRTSASAWRYSAVAKVSLGGLVPSAACCAADAASDPPARACSTPSARRGRSAMFVYATAASPLRVTAATPTMAQ